MIVAMILSSLALLAATAGLILEIRERKRSQKRNIALVRYVERLVSDALAKANEKTDTAVDTLRTEYGRRIGDLENGVVPDFEKAKAAANAVNDFNAGITSIMGFDPFESLRAQRDGNIGGDKG